MSYEDVAGTMAHELAHCVHGPHNASFYKLMDEILDQHAVLMARGIVATDSGGFPMHNSDQAYVLGGIGGGAIGIGTNKGTSAAAAAHARSQKKSRWMPQGPQKLGGALIIKGMKPGEAAAAAAAARRLADEKWCLPCTTVVELLAIE